MADAKLAEALYWRGIKDKRVLDVIEGLSRADFVPAEIASMAGRDEALPIGFEQTISQPYVVALMTSVLQLQPTDRVLEIGTGSGYQTAVLARLAKEVYSVEIVPELAREAAARLRRMRFDNVHLREGDGHRGWPEAAPFDAIIVTAAPDRIPDQLVGQLAVGGRLVAPVGAQSENQDLVLVRRTRASDADVQKLLGVRFVPMTRREAPN